MSKFESINYTRVVCKECKEETIIEPGRLFKSLNCKCVHEISEPFLEIDEYINKDGKLVELIGQFENGDYEIKYPNGNLDYRIPKKDFDRDFMRNVDLDKLGTNEVDIPTPLTIDDLKDKTIDEIKDEYLVDELKVLARSLKIRGSSQMNETKLVERLIEKVK